MRRWIRRLPYEIYRQLPLWARWQISWFMTDKLAVGLIFLVLHDGELLLLRHVYQDRWALPGGWLRRGESVEQCVRRELSEELRLDVREIRAFKVASVITRPVIDIALTCEATSQEVMVDGVEVSSARFFALHQLPPDLLPTHAPYIQLFLRQTLEAAASH